jgi:hypothetical protein
VTIPVITSVWSTSSLGISKATFAKGLLTQMETTTHKSGALKSVTAEVTIEGLPEKFDRRSNAQYTITSHLTYADDTTRDTTSKVTYTFKSSGLEKVGPCDLYVVHGDLDSVSDERPDRVIHQHQI